MDLQNVKNVLKKIIFLPPVPTLLISVPSYVLVIYALAGENVNSVIVYASYLLSSYALVITITGVKGIFCWIRRGIERHPLVQRLMGITLVGRYFRDDIFRAETGLYQGFFINFLYAGIKMFSGVRYKSIWFVTLAVYYILLAVMRFSLLYHVSREKVAGEDKAAEWRRYRLCGIVLLFMNFALSGIVILAVYQNSSFEYPGILIYLMGLYAFYAIITAVWNVIKFRRYENSVFSAAKVINLTAALVSMLSLETAMLSRFGGADDPEFGKFMTAAMGAGVSMVVLGMAFFMIVRSTIWLKHTGKEK